MRVITVHVALTYNYSFAVVDKNLLATAEIVKSYKLLGDLAQKLVELFHPTNLSTAGKRGGVIHPAPPRSVMDAVVTATTAAFPPST